MMKNIALLYFVLATFSLQLSAQVKASWRVKMKDNPTKAVYEVKEVNEHIAELSFALHANYETIKNYDYIEITAWRGEKKNGGTYKVEPSLWSLDGAASSDIVAGGKVAYIKVFNYIQDPIDGQGLLEGANGNFFLSKKGRDGSLFEPEDLYTLRILTFGATKVSEEQEWVNGRLVKKPIYEFTELLPETKLKVVTTDKIKPQGYNSNVRDVDELNSIFGGSAKDKVNSNNKISTFKVGDKVKVNWKKGGTWYPGKIGKVDGNKYFIEYDDGDEEWTTSEYIKLM